MAAGAREDDGRIAIAEYIAIISPYAICCALLYLFAFWGEFNINILEYAALSDIIKSAIYPVGKIFAVFVLGAVFMHMSGPPENLQPGGGVNSPIGRFLRGNVRPLATAYLAGLFAIYQYGPHVKWEILPVLVAMPVALLLMIAGVASKQIENTSLRLLICFLIAALPGYSYFGGRRQAENIALGDSFLYVVSTADGLSNPPSAGPSDRLRYIGQSGGYVFFLRPSSNTILVQKLDELKHLELAKYPPVMSMEGSRSSSKSASPSEGASYPRAASSAEFSASGKQ